MLFRSNTDFMINCIEELEESGKSSLKKSFYSRDGRYIGIILKITNGNPHTPMGYLFIAIDEIRMQNILEKGMISGAGGYDGAAGRVWLRCGRG